MRPMLASRADRVPTGPGWSHEVKWDGMRVIASVVGGRLLLTSRNENDVTVSYPELEGLRDRSVVGGRDVVLDGEVVAFSDGIPVFGALAERIHVRNRRKAEELAARHPVTLIVFDLIGLDGLEVTSLPFQQRRAALADLGLEGPHWQVPPTYDDGDSLLAATRAQGLEGIVSKRLTSPYRPGVRSEDWLKLAHRPTASYVVGGWRPEAVSDRLGAVLVGEMTPEGLVYRGRVGSGIAGKAGVRLAELLKGTTRGGSPFVNDVPPEDTVGTTWVEPRLVVEVASLGFTPQQRLRQPAYVGLRSDLLPEDLLTLFDGGGAMPDRRDDPGRGEFEREEVRVEVDGRTLTIVNLAKPMYPDTGTTKGEVLHYYAQVAPYLLPIVRDRAVTRIRWPHGTGDLQFFEKNLPPGAPKWLGRVEVTTTGSRATGDRAGVAGTLAYPFLDSLADLTYLVNLASLELHIHQWRFTRPRDGSLPQPLNPDRMVVDLDPGKPAGLHECAQVALIVRQRLADLGLPCSPVTSGSKGLHLYAPMPGDLDADQVRDAARLVAEELEAAYPNLVVASMHKARRAGRVFLDWSQNTASKTTISPYSLRGTLAPYAAAPRTWAEIEEGADEPGALTQLRYGEVLTRLAEHGDLFAVDW